eukprot:CAMPEP_0197073972 /NCGR_PEP_ID=MMETSP1384-20130603/210875_1 /TAXON_ID=29189 /ORGANISM="Ammonia sp." /LENGTH=348 /DNA_ID=CAMNT_0042512813 /DNA_START=38 /DNA_END=1081 /DNA_ORIENTATION=+
MGACVVAPEIETRQAETNAYAQKAAQLNATLRAKELPTGETLVPMNYISGEHPIKYPAWFNQQQLSAENWVQFLAQLNQISVPIISSAVQQMTDSALPHAYGGGRSLQQRRNERLQTLRPMLTASHSNLVDQMDALFLQWNQNVFKPVGLQCFADYDAWYTLTTLRAKELPTGETLVPMNYMSGEHPTKYPAWFNQQQLSAENWAQFLAQLNAISVSIVSTAVQQRADLALPLTRHHANKFKERDQKLTALLTASHSNLVDRTDALFLQWNQNVFKPVGLQCFADYDAWYTLIENGIYGDSMSNKRVGFLMKAVSAQQAMAVQPVQTVVVVQSQSEGQKQELPLPPGW